MSFESKIKQILKDVKHENPTKRFQALEQLNELKENDDIGLDFDIFEEIIKTASQPFPTTNEEWDDPSLWLIDFVSDYHISEIVDSISRYYQGFSKEAKVRAFYYLCSFDDENNLLAIMDIFDQYLPTHEAILVSEPLFEHPSWILKIIEKYYSYIENEHYKYSFYDLLLFAFENQIINQFHKEKILPVLQQDFIALKENHFLYNDSYNLKNVYHVWKENYLDLRFKIESVLMILPYYYNEEVQSIFDEAMKLNDPFLQIRALIPSMQFDAPVDVSLIHSLSENIETTQLMYYGLQRLRKEHLYMSGKEKQPFFARSFLFEYLKQHEDFEGVSHSIEMVDHLDIENDYGQPIRYYLASFTDVLGTTYVGWIGAFPLEVEDSIEMWEGTYSDFEEFDSSKIDFYKEQFLAKRSKEKSDYQNELLYEDRTVFNKRQLISYTVIVALWIFHFATSFSNGISVLFAVGITLYSAFDLFKWIKNKDSFIRIQGTTLTIFHHGKELTTELHEIKKISLKKEGRKRTALIYDKQNVLLFSFPTTAFDYDFFIDTVEELTSHLKEIPYLERVQ